MNWYQRLVIGSIIAWLQSTLKNPKAIGKELSIVTELNTYSAQILAMNGVTPSTGV